MLYVWKTLGHIHSDYFVCCWLYWLIDTSSLCLCLLELYPLCARAETAFSLFIRWLICVCGVELIQCHCWSWWIAVIIFMIINNRSFLACDTLESSAYSQFINCIIYTKNWDWTVCSKHLIGPSNFKLIWFHGQDLLFRCSCQFFGNQYWLSIIKNILISYGKKPGSDSLKTRGITIWHCVWNS